MISILKLISNLFRGSPWNPNEFVKKYVEDSHKERAQLEMIYEKEIILQVDSLKFVPSWFKVAKVDKDKYENGYVIFSVWNREGNFPAHYKPDVRYGDDYLKIEELHGNTPVVTSAKFVDSTIDFMSLAIEMKKFIDNFYSFEEPDPSILFNIRYLKGMEG